MALKRILTVLITLNLMLAAKGQEKYAISGRVTNGVSGAPIANASVYIANTSRGTVTNANGEFALHDVPVGNLELVVSYIGFIPASFPFSPDKLPMRKDVHLQPKPAELDAVVVKSFIKNGWEKWRDFFTIYFVGNSTFAREARIVNYKAVKFRFSTSTNVLEAVADETLIIENKALGYRINYDLDEFRFDTVAHEVYFQGHRFFNDLTKEQTKFPKRWIRNRLQAYQGSIMHFMRSLYRNQLVEEGFELKRVKFEGNDYYSTIAPQVNADSLIISTQDSIKAFYFKDYLSITYKNAKADGEYVNPISGNKGGWRQQSVINLLRIAPVSIEANGNYFPPLYIFQRGYWAWSEKVGHILPLDYEQEPDKTKK